MTQNIKERSLIKDVLPLLVSFIAIILSGFTFAYQIRSDNMAKLEATHRMLFGGYVLGKNYEHLILCNPKSIISQHCSSTTKPGDFNKLQPLTQILTGSSLSWGTLFNSESPFDFAKQGNEPSDLQPASLLRDALAVRFAERRVEDAFVLGQAMFALQGNLSLIPDGGSVGQLAETRFEDITRDTINPTLKSFDNMCDEKLFDPQKPSKVMVDSLDDCISETWLPSDRHRGSL